MLIRPRSLIKEVESLKKKVTAEVFKLLQQHTFHSFVIYIVSDSLEPNGSMVYWSVGVETHNHFEWLLVLFLN